MDGTRFEIWSDSAEPLFDRISLATSLACVFELSGGKMAIAEITKTEKCILTYVLVLRIRVFSVLQLYNS